MSSTTPIALQIFRKELRSAFKTYREDAIHDLNDGFAHWAEKQEIRHDEIIENLVALTARVDRSEKFDHLVRYLSGHLNVPAEELTG